MEGKITVLLELLEKTKKLEIALNDIDGLKETKFGIEILLTCSPPIVIPMQFHDLNLRIAQHIKLELIKKLVELGRETVDLIKKLNEG